MANENLSEHLSVLTNFESTSLAILIHVNSGQGGFGTGGAIMMGTFYVHHVLSTMQPSSPFIGPHLRRRPLAPNVLQLNSF